VKSAITFLLLMLSLLNQGSTDSSKACRKECCNASQPTCQTEAGQCFALPLMSTGQQAVSLVRKAVSAPLFYTIFYRDFIAFSIQQKRPVSNSFLQANHPKRSLYLRNRALII